METLNDSLTMNTLQHILKFYGNVQIRVLKVVYLER